MASAPAFQAQEVLERIVKAARASPAERVLDLACGPGIVAKAVAPLAHQLVGIDATPAMIHEGRRRMQRANVTNCQFAVASAECLPFSGGFDQVITRLALHHFSDVPAVLSETRRVLRPGGKLIVADVISSDDEDESALHNSVERLRDPTHIRMFPPTELLDAIGSAGFKIISQQSWKQPRAFPEWAAIIADPARTEPLENVMRALARAGQRAGINLHEEAGQLLFTHRWMMVVAQTG